MLQVARLSPSLLGDSAPLVGDFLRSQTADGGGFRDPAGQSDLYYTVFGIEGLLALQQPLPVERLCPYLDSFGAGAELDLVHLACLARCRAALPAEHQRREFREPMLAHLERYRAEDGGFDASPGAAQGTVYGCFMAYGAYQDLGAELPDADRLVDCLDSLKAPDGGYTNAREMPVGLTPPTAAVATLLRNLGQPVPPELAQWLTSRCHPSGGFFAIPDAPVPDLLSTATALHALSGLHADMSQLAEPCLDFLDSLWTASGGFYGSWEDDQLDCEYTYYGLLALGHLSLY